MSFWAFNLNQSPAGKAASSQSFFGSRELQRTSTQRNREFLKIRSMTVPQVGDNRLESWLHTKLSDTSYIFPMELSLQFAFLLSSCTWLYSHRWESVKTWNVCRKPPMASHSIWKSHLQTFWLTRRGPSLPCPRWQQSRGKKPRGTIDANNEK